MSLPFAEVAVAREGERFVALRATVKGLGGIAAPTRELFCSSAAGVVLERDPNIESVTFTGPSPKEKTTISRAPAADA